MDSWYRSLCNRCDTSVACLQTDALEATFCERVLQTLGIGAPKPGFCKGPTSASISKHNGKLSGSCSELR